jgi:poly(A) polymerase
MSNFVFDERALQALKTLQQAGFDSWFVGGCVRDSLLEKPFTDYDIATTAHPADCIPLFQKKFELDLKGEKFGCVRVNYEDLWLEITALRKDINPDGRHTKVTFTTDVAEDAKRRDFTINALYWNEKAIIDFFDGQKDLEQHEVKFIGKANDRVQEDYLRILRFFRFSSVYANELNQEGLKACVDHQEGLRYLSGNRIWSEWSKILFGKNTLRVLQVMETNDIDSTLLGAKISIANYLAYKGRDALLLTHLLLPSIHIQHLVHRLSLNQSQQEWLESANALLIDHDFRISYLQYGESAKELVLYWACKYKKNADEIFAQTFWSIPNPVFPLAGKDLLKLGCQPGPIVGNYLQRAHQWWVENNFSPSHQDCLCYVESILNK